MALQMKQAAVTHIASPWPSRSQPAQGCCNSREQNSVGRDRGLVVTRALQIDRRRHLELQLQRQVQRDLTLVQQSHAPGQVVEVLSLTHLDSMVEMAGSAVVILFLYSKSCGGCKAVLRSYAELSQDYGRQRAGVCCLKHDIWGEFDELTDVARFHRHPRKKGPIVPSFIFFVEGALVQRVRMSDVRSLSGSAAAIERLQVYEHKVLQTALRQLIWKNTPSARR